MSIKETFSAGQTREFYGKGDFFRLLETTEEITVEFFNQGREVAEAVGVQAGYAEYFRVTPFDRIRIYSATAQQVKWVIREGSDVRYDRGASSVTGTVALDAATLAALEKISIRPEASTGYWVNSAAAAVNTAITVFAAAANTTGKILLDAGACDNLGNPQSFIMKATAPANITDGEVIALSEAAVSTGSTQNTKLMGAVVIPAGMGLFFISGGNGGAGWARYARWRDLP